MSDLLLANLLSPFVLAFALGVAARTMGSDLRLPKDLYTSLSVYLLFALGLKGGVELSAADLSAIAGPALATLILGWVTPVSAYLALRRLGGFEKVDAAAIAAHYGAVSALGEGGVQGKAGRVVEAAREEVDVDFARRIDGAHEPPLSGAMRLELKTASAPPNASRASIASAVAPFSALALARMRSGFPRMSRMARSRSCTMRSSVTETSALRPVQGPSRTHSTRIGRSGAASSPIASNTRRSWCPQASVSCFSAAMRTSSAPSRAPAIRARSLAIGARPAVPEWFPFVPAFLTDPVVLLILLVPVQFWAGREFYLATWSGLRNRAASMDTLIVLGTTAALLYSVLSIFGIVMGMYFDAAAVIITLILLGRFLEAKAKSHTSDAIKKLLGLRAKTARVIRGGQEIDVPIEEVKIGDLIRVRPGEKIPV